MEMIDSIGGSKFRLEIPSRGNIGRAKRTSTIVLDIGEASVRRGEELLLALVNGISVFGKSWTYTRRLTRSVRINGDKEKRFR